MKARDVAALAALGLAGKLAYDKYGSKAAPAKAKAGDSYSNEGRNAKFSDEDYSNEGRSSVAPEYSNEGRGKAAPDYSNEGRGKAFRNTDSYGAENTRGGIQVAPVGSGLRSLVKTNSAGAAPAAPSTRAFTPPGAQSAMGAFTGAGGTNTSAPEENPNLRPFSTSNVPYDVEAPVAQRLAAINAANGADSESARQTDALANTSRAALLVDRANKINPTAMQASGVSTPSARATDKLAMTSRANQAAYLAQQRAEQARLDALRASGGRRAKGGVVKMASGGLASSKMSKPSGASRGDGIAQRGRTRGKYL